MDATPAAREPTGGVRRVAAIVGICAVIGFLGGLGCAVGGGQRPPWDQPRIRVVWPAPPEPPRIEYVGSLRSRADLGRSPGLADRLAAALFGERQASMVKPLAVAKNAAGLLAVADPGVPTVHFFDLARKEYERLEDGEALLLRSPVGIAVDDTGRVYIADSVQAKVFVLDENRKLIAEIGDGRLQRPTGLALGPRQERLYVVDTIACQVVVFDRDGTRIDEFGRRGTGIGEFNAPTFITVAPDGKISVSDSLNFRIQTFLPDGTALASFGRPGDGAGDLARPKGVATDKAGRFYVVDAAFENVQIFDPDGTLLLAFGGPGTGPGEFYLPTGLFMEAGGTVWVADSFNRRVQVFRLLAGDQ